MPGWSEPGFGTSGAAPGEFWTGGFDEFSGNWRLFTSKAKLSLSQVLSQEVSKIQQMVLLGAAVAKHRRGAGSDHRNSFLPFSGLEAEIPCHRAGSS